MSAFVISPTFVAGGAINVASFVKSDPSADNQVLQAGVGSQILGICQREAVQFPTSSSGTPLAAAVSGDHVTVYAGGSLVPLTAGAAGYTAGDYLTSDANGNAIKAKGGDNAGAIAISTAAAGDVRDVWALEPGSICPATSAGVATTAASLTLTPANSKQTITVTAVDKIITLPTVVGNAGFSVRIIYDGASAGGSTGTIITPATADAATALVIGHMVTTPAVTKGIVNTAASSIRGDAADLMCNGTNWYVTSFTGTWTRQA